MSREAMISVRSVVFVSGAGALVLAAACSSGTSNPVSPSADASASTDGSSVADTSSMPSKDGSMGNDAGTSNDTGTGADTGGGTADTGGGAADTGGGTDGMTGSDGGACPAIANTAPTINDTAMSGPVPVGTGGAIADGTYYMTSNIGYLNMNGGKMHSYTIKITGNALDLTGHDDSAADMSGRFTVTNDVTKGTLSLIGSCPASVVGANLGATSYTATGSTFNVYDSANNNASIFTKQ